MERRIDEKTIEIKGKEEKNEKDDNEKKLQESKKDEKILESKSEEEKKKEEIESEKEEIKEEKKKEEIGVFIIPLRKAFRKARNKRAKYAIKLIREFVERKTKSKNIKIGKHLNENIWKRGIEKPPRRVKVKVCKVGDEYRVELFGYEYEEFEIEEGEKKEGVAEKLMQRLGPKAIKKQQEEEMLK